MLVDDSVGFSVDAHDVDLIGFASHNATWLGFTIASSNGNIATQSLDKMASTLPVNRQNILPPFLGHWFVVVEEKGEWFFHRGQYGFCCLDCQSIFFTLSLLFDDSVSFSVDAH